MIELELEKTYLLKRLPDGLADCRSEIIGDAFIPVSSKHPVVRLRHRGDRYEITKKEPVDGTDSTRQTEHTIMLTAEEAAAFASIEAYRFTKRRYYCTIDGASAEVDLYLEDLAGLAVVDFEFASDEAMAAFTMPEICLADVSQEVTFAGGMLAGRKYADIADALATHHYQPLVLEETTK